MYRNYRRENREKNSYKNDIAILANSHVMIRGVIQIKFNQFV